MSFKQIADWLNDNDFTTPRGKKFLNAHAISIVAKKQRRDAKFAKRFPSKLQVGWMKSAISVFENLSTPIINCKASKIAGALNIERSSIDIRFIKSPQEVPFS